MLTIFKLFFWQPHAKITFQSQRMIFQKSNDPFHFWTFFLSIFENPKILLRI